MCRNSGACFKFCAQGSASSALCSSFSQFRSLLKVQLVPLSEELVLCDLSTGVPRLLVPVPLHKPLFIQLHGLPHPGVRASCRLISQHFVCKNLSKDEGLWARSCIPCQKSKIQTHTCSVVPQIPVPRRRISHLHVDLVGPLPVSDVFNYLFTMVDRTTIGGRKLFQLPLRFLKFLKQFMEDSCILGKCTNWGGSSIQGWSGFRAAYRDGAASEQHTGMERLQRKSTF